VDKDKDKGKDEDEAWVAGLTGMKEKVGVVLDCNMVSADQHLPQYEYTISC